MDIRSLRDWIRRKDTRKYEKPIDKKKVEAIDKVSELAGGVFIVTAGIIKAE